MYNGAIPQSEIRDFCQPPLHKGAMKTRLLYTGEHEMVPLRKTAFVLSVQFQGLLVPKPESRAVVASVKPSVWMAWEATRTFTVLVV